MEENYRVLLVSKFYEYLLKTKSLLGLCSNKMATLCTKELTDEQKHMLIIELTGINLIIDGKTNELEKGQINIEDEIKSFLENLTR